MIKTINLNNGIEMPVIGLGTYQIGTDEVKSCVRDALQMGYRLIDTAAYYGNEVGVGCAIESSSIDRSDVFITTKLQSRNNVAHQIDESLKKLRTDYIDLLLIHWVMGNDIETWRVMENYVRDGKVRSIGLSNFYGRHYDNIIQQCDIMPAVNQIEVNPLFQNVEAVRKLQNDGIAVEAWAPLGEGRGGILHNKTLLRIAAKHGRSVSQTIINYLLGKNIIVIPKSTNRVHMKENLPSEDFTLDKEDISEIEALDKGESLFGWY